MPSAIVRTGWGLLPSTSMSHYFVLAADKGLDKSLCGKLGFFDANLELIQRPKGSKCSVCYDRISTVGKRREAIAEDELVFLKQHERQRIKKDN